MKILVTGGGGFLGRYICRDLKSEGHEVYSFSRKHYKHLDKLSVSTRKGSLHSLSDIKQALVGIDAVFHTAAIAGVWGRKKEFYNTNLEGTKKLVTACKELGIKYFINTSSPSVVFEKEDIINGDESLDYPKRFLTHYAETKALAEKYVLSHIDANFLALSLRPHLIFGKEDPHIIPRLIKSAKENKLKIVGEANNLVDVIYVENASMAHVKAFKALLSNSSLSGNVYFIGQEEPVILWDFINNILKLKNTPIVEDKISFKLAYRLGAFFEFIYRVLGIYKPEPRMTRFVACQLAKSHYFSHSKAKEHFSFAPRFSTKEAIEITCS